MARAERQVPFGAAFDAAVGKSFPRNFVPWKFGNIFLAENIEIQQIHQQKARIEELWPFACRTGVD